MVLAVAFAVVAAAHVLRRRAKRLLRDVEPQFATELGAALRKAGEPGLAASVFRLVVENACGCDDPDCASFYTVPRLKARSLWLGGGRTVRLESDRGTLAADVVDGTIVSVEVLGRPELRSSLLEYTR